MSEKNNKTNFSKDNRIKEISSKQEQVTKSTTVPERQKEEKKKKE